MARQHSRSGYLAIKAVEPYARALDQPPQVFAVDLGEAGRERNVSARRLQHARDEVGFEPQEDAPSQLAVAEMPRLARVLVGPRPEVGRFDHPRRRKNDRRAHVLEKLSDVARPAL